jgi:hypothetical protein
LNARVPGATGLAESVIFCVLGRWIARRRIRVVACRAIGRIVAGIYREGRGGRLDLVVANAAAIGCKTG